MQYNDIFNYKSIVFRGKNILNNNWIYGYFKQDNKVPFCKLMVRAAVTKGYNGKMPSRFQNLLDKIEKI